MHRLHGLSHSSRIPHHLFPQSISEGPTLGAAPGALTCLVLHLLLAPASSRQRGGRGRQHISHLVKDGGVASRCRNPNLLEEFVTDRILVFWIEIRAAKDNPEKTMGLSSQKLKHQMLPLLRNTRRREKFPWHLQNPVCPPMPSWLPPPAVVCQPP